jgi:hypothetical protein
LASSPFSRPYRLETIGTVAVMDRTTRIISGIVAGRTARRHTVRATRRVTASIHQAMAITITRVSFVATAAETMADTVTAHIPDVEEADITDIPRSTLTSGRSTSDSVTSPSTALIDVFSL